MKSATVFKKLKKYLTPLQSGRLELVHSLAPDCVIILTMADVMKEYNSTDDEEREVCRLFEQLAKNHFNKRRKSNTPT